MSPPDWLAMLVRLLSGLVTTGYTRPRTIAETSKQVTMTTMEAAATVTKRPNFMPEMNAKYKQTHKPQPISSLCTIYVPTNLPIWPICKLAGQSANLRLAIQVANGTTNLKIIFEVCSLSVKHIYTAISYLASFQTNGFYWSISYWMLIFDFKWHKTSINGNYLWWKILTAMTMVKISDCFYKFYYINSLCFVTKLAGMICKLDRFLEIL